MFDVIKPLLQYIVVLEVAYWWLLLYLNRRTRKALKQRMELATMYSQKTGEIFTDNLLQMAHLHGYTEIESVTVSFNKQWEPVLKFGTAWHTMIHPYSGGIDGEQWLALCERWRMTHRPQEEIEE